MKVKQKNMEMDTMQARGLLLTRRRQSQRRAEAKRYKNLKISAFCLMLIICTICQAQKLDIKPYFIYHQSVAKQTEPVFYDIDVAVPFFARANKMYFASSFSKDFTLSNGLEYGLAIDYTFRNNLGVELGLGYYSSLTSPFINKPGIGVAPNSCTTNWNYHSTGIRLLVTYSMMRGKSSFIGKTGPVIHYASADMDAFLENSKVSTCTFDNHLNWGYLIGLEYNYQLSNQLALVAEFGFEQYKYTPNKATVEYLEYRDPAREKYGVQYVNESILFRSVYFGIGIKYNLWKKIKKI